MDVNFNLSLFGIIHWFFKFLQSLGISSEFVILSIIGIVVSVLLWKQYKADKKHRKQLIELFETISKGFKDFSNEIVKLKEDVFTNMTKIQMHHEKCFQCATDRNTKQEITRETMKEKLDTIEDGIKEIKKTLLFK